VAQQLDLFAAAPVGPPSPPGRVLVARGARAAEALLLERLDALAAEVRKDPSRLALPVRVVVPSRSLRVHLGAAIVRQRGRSVAGVTIQTLHGLALEILERVGETAAGGAALFEVLAQRLARRESSLRRGLEDLVDGYGAVSGTVRDLVDAGLEPVHAEVADEALATDGPLAGGRAEVERARALVRVAASAEQVMRGLGLGRVSTLLRRATDLVEDDPERALPARAILIHGFADATGVATDLLQALLRRRSAWLVLDRPPDPAVDGGVEKAFTERFVERLSIAARLEPATPRTIPGPPSVEGFEAVGGEAEVRELAWRVRALLDGGARPEGIGVVARDLSPYRLPLRRHFHRLGVPFSGMAERGALEPAGRRARAFLELLRQGDEVPADRWLDAVASLPAGGGSRKPIAGLLVDLRLAFYSLGAARLRDVAELSVEDVLKDGSYALPIRQGLKTTSAASEEEPEGGEEGGGPEAGAYANRRRVAGSQIRAAARAAIRLRERLAGWPEAAPAGEHLARLRGMLTSDLGWDSAAPESRPVLAALDELERELPAGFDLNRDELRTLLGRALETAGTSDLGGHGGGVQVLSVMESRGRTFEHLFIAGLNRDVFPRGVREDPLLPDPLRRILQRVLPDVPLKRSGFDEERHLFAQLLSASPAVTLSWQIADDDARPVSPSPLAERLRERIEVAKAPPLWALPPAGPLAGPRTADEHAVMAALHAPRRWFARVLPLAVSEVRAEAAPAVLPLDPAGLTAARLAVLDEMDPDLRTPEGRAVRAGLGPYFGFVGAVRHGSGESEPRLRDLFVTHLENLAACPWQLFLGRLLRIEPTPDPLAALPGLDALLLGNTVHAALARIAEVPLAGEAGERVLDRPALSVPWPDGEEVDRVLREEARRLLAEEGIFLPGLVRALAERARPLLDTARDLDWAGQPVPVLATELQGELETNDGAGRPKRILFKADRVGREGRDLVWTDYKTGRPLSEARRAEKQRDHFLARVKAGTHLQAVAYLLGSEEEKSTGRYLFIRPDREEGENREFAVTREDQDFLDAFAATTAAVLDVWEAGAFFPRLVDTAGRNEPVRCSFCAVAEACLRGDSGARQRLFAWTEKAPESAEGPEESALWNVWRLAAKEA